MRDVIIPDKEIFDAFEDRELVDVNVVAPETLVDYKEGETVEVYETANEKRYRHHKAKIVSYHGSITEPSTAGKPDVIRITVRRIAEQDIYLR